MPSLLLRLSDDNPQTEEESYRTEEKSDWLLKELRMLLSSRSRFAHVETLPLVNASVVNYGINVSVSEINDTEQRKKLIEEQIKMTLQRFEPRLSDVTIMAKTNHSSHVIFEIKALHHAQPVTFELMWDDCTGKFYFDE